MRKSAQIALLLGLMGALACAQGATTPKGEVAAYDDEIGDGDGDDEAAEETGDGDVEETGDGDGDVATGDGDGDGDGDEDSDFSGATDAGAPAAGGLGGIGDFFNQLLGIFGGQPAGGSDAGTP